MSSLLLRLSLCLCLVLNGASVAYASTAMELMMQVGAVSGNDAVSHRDDGDCHGSNRDRGQDAGRHHHDATAHNGQHGPDIHVPPAHAMEGDCCQADACCGLCAQHSSSARSEASIAAMVFETTLVVRRSDQAHDAPQPPRLIRPPIA